MGRKNSCFRFEQCLETSLRLQKICKEMLADGFQVYLLTDLPEQAFYRKVCDFALDHRIRCRNIIFNTGMPISEVAAQYRLRAYFSANLLEVDELNASVPKAVGYYIPD